MATEGVAVPRRCGARRVTRPRTTDPLEWNREREEWCRERRRNAAHARWLAESRDYWRERARAAEWGLNAALREVRRHRAASTDSSPTVESERVA